MKSFAKVAIVALFGVIAVSQQGCFGKEGGDTDTDTDAANDGKKGEAKGQETKEQTEAEGQETKKFVAKGAETANNNWHAKLALHKAHPASASFQQKQAHLRQ